MQVKGVSKVLAAGTILLMSGVVGAKADEDCFDKGNLSYGSCGGYDWTGPYIGAHVGYGEFDNGGGYNTQQQAEALFARRLSPTGLAYGLQLGYNVMASTFVFGLELDASIYDGDDTISKPLPDIQNMSSKVDAFGSLRAKVGVPIDNILPFITGGVGLVDQELVINDISNGQTFKEDETLLAAVFGGGLELGVTSDVTLRAEGLYYYVGEGFDHIEPGAAQPTTTYFEDLWTVRGAVNWRF